MKYWLSMIIASALLLGSVPAMAGPVENRLAVVALGGQDWNCRNNNGALCYNFSRGNHRLRLEDVNINRVSGPHGVRYYGTFTMTNRRHWKPDPHVFVAFSAVGGVFQKYDLQTDGGGSWFDVLPVGSARKVVDVIEKIGTHGNAQVPMGQAIWSITEYFRLRSGGQ
ncbi:MAG: hypothetical protein R3B70_30685 [Polyangiaceae bacterium]